ncbi:hypothetical protein BD779DRAFT_170319 [Infundibulicybe gibba]|nr:hypothetical protein BD779DRAFT_170319 [Infundibulicybe gibba]
MLELLPCATRSSGLRIALLFLSAMWFLAAVGSLPTSGGNITLPDGLTNHGDPRLICTSTTWTDIVIFYLGNYFAHAATIKTYPGESGVDFMMNALMAILFPTAGITRGIDAIVRHSAWVKGSELQKAARAGALCMVVRSKDWKPVAGGQIHDAELVGPNEAGSARKNREPPDQQEVGDEGVEKIKWDNVIVSTYAPDWLADNWRYWPSIHRSGICFNARTMHGLHKLPAGYSFAPVPHDALVLDLGISQSSTIGQESATNICSVFNFPQVAASLFQSLYAIFTLYRSRGDQISRYGYAAFSLTVAPYAIMSAINLVGGLLTPTYPTLYLIGSSILDEAKSRPGAQFDGIIGRIAETSEILALDLGGTFENQNGSDKSLFFRVEGSDDADNKPPTPPYEGPFKVIEADGSREHLVLRTPSCPRFQRIRSTEYQSSRTRSLLHTQGFISRLQRMKLVTIVQPPFRSPGSNRTFAQFVCLAVGSVSVAIVGGFSGFHPGQSTKAQRVWITTWLVFGVIIGIPMAFQESMMAFSKMGPGAIATSMIPPAAEDSDSNSDSDDSDESDPNSISRNQILKVSHLCAGLLYGVPAVGGFVVVGKMLLEYGSCVRLLG